MWSWGGWKSITTLGFLWLGIAIDGMCDAWSAPCVVTLPRRAWSAARLCPVMSPRTVAVPCKWSTGPALHYSCTIAACPHVLHALNALPAHMSYSPMMTLTSGTLETCARALRICESSCTGRPARLFFMFKTRGP
jgi:hypothetical protein